MAEVNTIYSERLFQIRNEVIESIRDTLYAICQKTNLCSIAWENLTDYTYTNITYETDNDVQSVLPETIGFVDLDCRSFIITFVTHNEYEPSIDGSNLYVETLIDILQYLENYNKKL